MLALDSPVAKIEWAREAQRNGISPVPQAAGKGAPDAGPWAAALQKLLGFQHVGQDWDGFGARRPSPELVKSAIGLAYLLSEKGMEPPNGVLHSTDGTVVFEWQARDGTYAEVEIDRPLHAEVMLIEPGKPAKHWILPTE
jgi:hypothetical protein